MTAQPVGDLIGPLETDAIAKDRTHIPVELTAFPVDDGEGSVSMVAVTLRDVRERRESRRLMREAERARTDVEKVGQLGSFEWVPETGDLIWSDEVWRIHGRTPGGPPAEDYLDSVHPGDRAALKEARREAAQSGRALDVRYRIVPPDGGFAGFTSTPSPTWLTSRAVGGHVPRRDRHRAGGGGGTRRAGRAQRQALHDPLTALPNRTLLIDRLSMALAHAERARSGVAVIVCDIDRFTLVNEELGHAFGDQVMKAVAQRLVGIMRVGDTVGRLAGDEFALVCESIESDKNAVDALASRIVDAFGEPFVVRGQELFPRRIGRRCLGCRGGAG